MLTLKYYSYYLLPLTYEDIFFNGKFSGYFCPRSIQKCPFPYFSRRFTFTLQDSEESWSAKFWANRINRKNLSFLLRRISGAVKPQRWPWRKLCNGFLLVHNFNAIVGKFFYPFTLILVECPLGLTADMKSTVKLTNRDDFHL